MVSNLLKRELGLIKSSHAPLHDFSISKNQIVDLSNFRDGSQMKQLHISPTSKILNKISSKMVKVPEVELDMYFNSKKVNHETN